MPKMPDRLLEQPMWLRQTLFALRQLTIERRPDQATSWPQEAELVPSSGTPVEVSEDAITVPLEPTESVEDPASSDIYATAPGYFDNVEGWIAKSYRKPFYKSGHHMLPFKGRSTPAKVEDRTHIGCHITAVEFGTTRWRRAFWKKVIESGEMPEEVLARYDLGDVDKTAERIALHERFWKVPYHVVGLINGDILKNNGLLDYTYHGNYLNDEAIGLSAEANLPGIQKLYNSNKHTAVDDFWIETNRKAFLVAYEMCLDAGFPLRGVRCHRQASSGRLGDPGEQYYKTVLRPMASRLGLAIDIHYKVGSGNPIPVEWDDHGVVNYRGRKIS